MYQFLHIDSFAAKPSTASTEPRKNGRRKRKRSAKQVVAEAMREPGQSAVPANMVQQPTVLWGDARRTLERAKALAAQAGDASGRKLRSDAHILAGVVQSFPLSWKQIGDNPVEQERLRNWVDATVQWNLETFGKGNVGYICVHTDEPYPHVHSLLLPPQPGEEPSPMRRAAKRKSRELPKSTPKDKRQSAERSAYIIEARRLQDLYYRQVSMQFGHSRLGPGRARLERGEWMHRKAMLKEFAAAEAASQATISAAQASARELLKNAQERLAATDQRAQQTLAAAERAATHTRSLANSKLADAQRLHAELTDAQEAQVSHQQSFQAEAEKLLQAIQKLPPAAKGALAELLKTAKRISTFLSAPPIPQIETDSSSDESNDADIDNSFTPGP